MLFRLFSKIVNIKNLILFFLIFYASFAFSGEFRKELLLSSYIKGAKLANGVGILTFSNERYSFLLNSNTVGIFSFIFDWKQEILVFSEIKNQELVSKEYKSKDERKNKKGHMHLLFNDRVPKIISAQPHPKDDERRFILNKNILKNTNDPITGIINIGFKNECKKSSRVFDGKRRYTISTENVGTDIIKKNDFFDQDIEVIKCLFDIEKIAGYTSKEMKKYPTKGIIWFKEYKDINLYLPAKLEIVTNWGSFICLIKERKK